MLKPPRAYNYSEDTFDDNTEVALSTAALRRLAAEVLRLIVAAAFDDIALEAWQADMTELTKNFRDSANVATASAKAAATQSWTQWADAAMEKGGSRMHKVCAVQLPWSPYAVLSS